MLLFFICSWLPAQIVLDGTTGTPGALSGPVFEITPELGDIHGTNIFYSFSEFSLGANQTARYHTGAGTGGINRLISRVTGGNISSINGAIRSDFPNADFYFINPAGVHFGAEASLAIDGSFYVSTAERIRFADGGSFDAATPANSLLTSAAPAAFGFGENPGTLEVRDNYQAVAIGPPGPNRQTVNAPRIYVPPGETLAFIGGDIIIDASVLQMGAIPEQAANNLGLPYEGGAEIVFASAASVGQIRISPGTAVAIQTSDGIVGGAIELTLTGMYAQAGEISGHGISMFGGDIRIDNSVLLANASSSGSPRGIAIDAQGSFDLRQSTLTAASIGDGKGGTITIDADDVTLRDNSIVRAETLGNSDAGAVIINADNIAISEGASIQASAKPTPPQIVPGSPPVSATPATGKGGSVLLKATEDVLVDGSVITASSESLGDSGNIQVEAEGAITLQNQGRIAVDSLGSGNGGQVTLLGGTIRLFSTPRVSEAGVQQGQSAVSASSLSSGNAGRIRIVGDIIELRMPGVAAEDDQPANTINSVPSGTGAGGDIHLEARVIRMLENGGIAAPAGGAGNGGNLHIIASELLEISDKNSGIFMGAPYSQTVTGPRGDGGNILIEAGAMVLANEGRVIAATSSAGNGGNVDIQADSLTIAARAHINTNSEWPGEAGKAGDIVLSVGNLVLQSGAQIRSSTNGQLASGSHAGTIVISSTDITLEPGTFIASEAGSLDFHPLFTGDRVPGDANAGQVFVNADSITLAGTISSATQLDGGSAGEVHIGDLDTLHRAFEQAFDAQAERLFEANGFLDAYNARTLAQFEIASTGRVTSESTGTGDANRVTIVAGSFTMHGGSVSSAVEKYAGDAGQVQITIAGDILIADADVSSSTGVPQPDGQFDPQSSGNAGQIRITGNGIELVNATIATAAYGTGTADDAHVLIEARHDFNMRGGQLSTAASAPGQPAGRIFVQAGFEQTPAAGNMTIRGAIIDAQSKGDGGNIYLYAPDIISIADSIINATAGADGGEIFIGQHPAPPSNSRALVVAPPTPSCIILERSVLQGLAGGSPVKVVIDAGHFLNAENTILTDTPPTVPDTNTVEGLVAYEAPPITVADLLQNRCAVKLPGNISSFIIVGPGGMPVDSDWLLPGLVSP
jgi:filamentous hemagglutinin family protein